VRAGDGMGFTAFRTEKSVSEEILRGEEVEVGGWEAVFGSGELRSFFRCSGGFMGFVFGGVVRYFRLLGSYPVGGGGCMQQVSERGRDFGELCWDVFERANADLCGATGAELREGDFHGEMEAKAKMNW